MGNVFSSSLVNAEKTSWTQPHELGYLQSLREEQIKLLSKFGEDLKLCYDNRFLKKIKYPYQHWWITDGVWILEFGGGDISDINVLVHCNPMKNYKYESKFKLTSQVMERMRNVCGTTNYSLALRNCEHLARYIHCGSWISFQMVGSGVLKKYLFDHMSTYTKQINTFPKELQPERMGQVVLYPDAPPTWSIIKYKQIKQVMTETDQKYFNIVMLGPTGSGKSTLINNLFNLTVCKAGDSAESVTKQIMFYQGTFNWMLSDSGSVQKPVNIIDTIGFCDSLMKAADVLDAIKASVKINVPHIDKVVIVCSGRIEKGHKESIKQFMKWLNFSDYKDKFAFVYNKADTQSDQSRMENLLSMCNTFNADTKQTQNWEEYADYANKLSIKMNMTTGFPPGASFDQVAEDHQNFIRACLCTGPGGPNTGKRIPVDKTKCIIS